MPSTPHRTAPFARACLLATLALAAAAPAQERSSGRQPDVRENTISIHFGGGSLEAFLQQLCKENPQVNVVASTTAKAVALPQLEVANAAPESLLQAVCRIAPQPYAVSVQRMAAPGTTDVFSVSVHSQHGPGPQMQEARMSVFRLTGFDAEWTDKILAAVDTGLGIADGTKPTVRFHEASGLLFVKGSPEQLSVVQQVLGAIGPPPAPRPEADKQDSRRRNDR